MTRRVHDPGDIIVVGAVFRVDGVLTDPSTIVARVQRPDGVVLNSEDSPTTVEVNPSTSAPVEQLAALGITTAENDDATGVATVRFRAVINDESTANASGTWKVSVQGTGSADGFEDYPIQIRVPAVPFVWADGVTLS